MTERSQVEDELENLWEGRNLVEVFPECLELLVKNTQRGGVLSPDGPDSLWQRFAGKLFEFRAFDLAALALRELYRLQCEEQGSAERRYHKGWPLHNIGAAYLSQNRPSIARRYITLAYIGDVLTGGPEAPGMAYPVLTGILGIPRTELDRLSAFTVERRDEELARFPEEILLAFQEAGLQSRDAEHRLFHPNFAYAQALYAAMDSPQDRGLALERLMAHLLTAIDGFELAEFRERAQDHETDLLLRNAVQGDPLFNVFGPYVAVECKNWEKAVGVREVNHFISQLRFAYLRSGILAASNGVSGSAKEKRNAELAILKAFHQDNVIVCVITNSDLTAIIDGRASLPALLLAEYERIRFDKRMR